MKNEKIVTVKNKETGQVFRVFQNEAADFVKTGNFIYSTKGKFKAQQRRSK